MPLDHFEFERGAVCFALFGYTAGFPVEVIERDAQGFVDKAESVASIDAFAREIRRGDVPEIVSRFKLRPVLVLQSATNPGLQDVTVARINSVAADKKAGKSGWWQRVSADRHITAYLVGDRPDHGLGSDAVVNLMAIQTISKSNVLRRVGSLDVEEMRAVSERIVRVLELDISELIAKASSGSAGDPK